MKDMNLYGKTYESEMYIVFDKDFRVGTVKPLPKNDKKYKEKRSYKSEYMTRAEVADLVQLSVRKIQDMPEFKSIERRIGKRTIRYKREDVEIVMNSFLVGK